MRQGALIIMSDIDNGERVIEFEAYCLSRKIFHHYEVRLCTYGREKSFFCSMHSSICPS